MLLNAVSGRGEFAVLVGDRRRTAAYVHCIFPPTVIFDMIVTHNDTSKY